MRQDPGQALIIISSMRLKIKFLSLFLYHINLENSLYSYYWYSTKYEFQRKTGFKAYIWRGNNGKIVRTVLKKRWWWSLADKWDPNECDFIWTQWLKPKVIKNIARTVESSIEKHQSLTYDSKENTEHSFKQTCIYNRISKNYHLANKKNLFLNLKKYYLALDKDPNDYIPMTYLIKKGTDDESFKSFLLQTKHLKNICWIIKPGENTNRGRGIKLCNGFTELITYMKRHKRRSYIVQRNISTSHYSSINVNLTSECLGFSQLSMGVRKDTFSKKDIWELVSAKHPNSIASKEFTCKNISNRFIHLTNDAVQKKSEHYGKYETSNKLSYLDFEKIFKISLPS